MSKVLVTEENLYNIANAIRSKSQGSDTYRPGDMAAAILAIPTGSTSTLVSKTITQNGEYDPEDDNADGYSDVTVNVPNSYTAGDEGKVVSSGALVAQTSTTVTQNGTYDTTENNEVVVNVSGGGGSGVVLSGTSAPTAAIGNNQDLYVQYVVSSVGRYTNLISALYRKVNNEWVDYVSEGNAIHVWTKSTGGYDAAIYVRSCVYNQTTDSYTEIGDTISVRYQDVQGSNTYDCFGLATLGYPNGWRIVASGSITDGTATYSNGDTVATWTYSTTKDIYLRWAQ